MENANGKAWWTSSFFGRLGNYDELMRVSRAHVNMCNSASAMCVHVNVCGTAANHNVSAALPPIIVSPRHRRHFVSAALPPLLQSSCLRGIAATLSNVRGSAAHI